MTKFSRSMVIVPALLASIAGVALAGDYDPTGQSGQYDSLRPAVRVKGTGGDFAPSRVTVPFIVPNLTGNFNIFLNSSVTENINGAPISAVTTFGVGTAAASADRIAAMLGTTDAGSPLASGESVNAILREAANNTRSNSHGAILPDGTLATRENFSTSAGGQNNIGLWNAAHTLGVAEPIQAPFKGFLTTAVNVGNATETAINAQTAIVRGSVFFSTPSIMRDGPGDEGILIGQTLFNGLPVVTNIQFPATFNGTGIYRGFNNDLISGTPGPDQNGTPGADAVAGWTQTAAPLPTTPGGETRTDARQTAPLIELVTTPGGRQVIYTAHGVGYAGGSPFSGGSARPILIAVDTITNPDGTRRLNYVGSNATLSHNTILIEADVVGGPGTQHGRPYDAAAPLDPGFANHFVSSISQKFVDHQATGGGNSFANSNFDMNNKGQIAALWVDEGAAPQAYEIRVYDPIWDAATDRIVGYNLGNVITSNGEVGLDARPIAVTEILNTVESTPGVFVESRLSPFSGVAIDNAGKVAFVGVREIFSRTGDWDFDIGTPETAYLENTTSSLFIWEPTTNTLHDVLSGGQNGDTLMDAFPADGPATNERLDMGFFPIDEPSDGFNRDSLSRTGDFLSVVFRSGGNETLNGVNIELETAPDLSSDTFNDDGGVLARGSGATLNERAVRGVAVVELGDFITVPTCNACIACQGQVNFGCVGAILANFGAQGQAGISGDVNCDGNVTFGDIGDLLAVFGQSCP